MILAGSQLKAHICSRAICQPFLIASGSLGLCPLFNILQYFSIVWMKGLSLKSEWVKMAGRVQWRWSWQSEESFDIKKVNFDKAEIQYTACGHLTMKRALTEWQQ